MKEEYVHMLARQAIGEYMMKHIAGIMEIIQDKQIRHKEEALDENALVIIEAEVKAIAEEILRNNAETKGHDR